MPSPVLLIHIFAAVVGLLSGALAMLFRKGSGLHGAAGTVFFVSMLTMSASAVYVATFERPIAINVVAGLLTFYLVATAWWAARHREGKIGFFDIGALLFVLIVGVLSFSFGAEGKKDGIPAGVFFFFGIIAFGCALTDIRMLKRGGLIGTQRIARHLWRMSSALLIALMSFVPGNARLLSDSVRQSGLVYLPHFLLIGAMIYWRVRVRRRKHQNTQHADPPFALRAGPA
jgi:uncharacterized membrane protein